MVSRLTDMHEAGRASPWAVSDAPPDFVRSQLRGIVGLRMPIARLEGKCKMSQNRTAADRAGVAAGLRAKQPPVRPGRSRARPRLNEAGRPATINREIAMPDLSQFALYVAVALLLAVTPGPGIFYVAARTLAGGRADGIASSLGTGLGGMVHVVAGSLGVSAIVLRAPSSSPR